jgi:hypothetical protein
VYWSTPSAAYGCLKALIGSNGVIREDAAITPTAYSEPIGICHSDVHHMIDAREQVGEFSIAPVGKNVWPYFSPRPALPR